MPPEQLTQWRSLLLAHLPQLSQPQSQVLALYSFGAAACGHCGLARVSMQLSLLLPHVAFNTIRQRLREFYKPAEAKSGRQRQQLDVSCCFAGLLGWIIALLKCDQLALGLDATKLGNRFAVLSISVLYRGTAIPVAWRVLPAMRKGTWRRPWLELLTQLADVVPASVTVLACGDRGLYSKWLFDAICECGWHPMLRINDQSGFDCVDGSSYRRFSDVLPQDYQPVSLSGAAFNTRYSRNRLECTLLAYHSPKYKDPWLVLTDLPPDQARVQCYGLRSWIEQGFKDIKRGCLHWQRTRMDDPQRVERLWLVLAVTQLLLVVLGTLQEDQQQTATAKYDAEHQGDLQTPTTKKSKRSANGAYRRPLRLAYLGHLVLLAMLCSGRALRRLYLKADPWPELPPDAQLPPLLVGVCQEIPP